MAYFVCGVDQALCGVDDGCAQGYGEAFLFEGVAVVAGIGVLGGVDVEFFAGYHDVAVWRQNVTADLPVALACHDGGVAREAANQAAAVGGGLGVAFGAFFLGADEDAGSARAHEARALAVPVVLFCLGVLGSNDVDFLPGLDLGARIADDVAAADVDVLPALQGDGASTDVAAYGLGGVYFVGLGVAAAAKEAAAFSVVGIVQVGGGCTGFYGDVSSGL